jgi:hypothetical protein
LLDCLEETDDLKCSEESKNAVDYSISVLNTNVKVTLCPCKCKCEEYR